MDMYISDLPTLNTNFRLGNLRGGDHLEDLGVDGRIILRWIVRKWGEKVWTECIWLRWGPVAGCCEHGNELSGSIKGGKFLDQLSNCYLQEKDSALWSLMGRWRKMQLSRLCDALCHNTFYFRDVCCANVSKLSVRPPLCSIMNFQFLAPLNKVTLLFPEVRCMMGRHALQSAWSV
jgi:hypothetical protein